ncbi:small, acid-soluble spore protein, alpha/beta type [Caldinitratiruptor microaerophilus]|uniref:Small, acid-soluble spore protein, alpha/beta type n=1 Tax=Caldinitratiruptor microaerophilus TaxID=671077 RepID=A0AA35G857_9FIRM|nr:small, acid-soluble spore protein, alpha/beta type [Caldinitratiruptor microaerophilus]BDG58939.1 hypothetical protein caldi_00290 [Caldinitratiruptor microaerophilus]
MARAKRGARPKPPTPLDLLKLQIAEEVGLGDKVREQGWGMLTAAESGRVGGLLGRRLRQMGLTVGPRGTLLRAEGS